LAGISRIAESFPQRCRHWCAGDDEALKADIVMRHRASLAMQHEQRLSGTHRHVPTALHHIQPALQRGEQGERVVTVADHLRRPLKANRRADEGRDAQTGHHPCESLRVEPVARTGLDVQAHRLLLEDVAPKR
jgi:hypothetical protein